MKRKALIISLIITGVLLGSGCKKDREQVEKLAQETQEAEAKTSQLDSSQMTPAKEQDSAVAQPQEYVSSPEKTPDAIPEAEITPVTKEASSKSEPESAELQKPATAMPPRIVEGYTVQIGSSTSRSYADKLTGQYAERGYQAYVSETDVEGVPHFRIRIGGFETIAEARKMGEELAAKYGVSFWIDKNLK